MLTSYAHPIITGTGRVSIIMEDQYILNNTNFANCFSLWYIYHFIFIISNFTHILIYYLYLYLITYCVMR